MKFQNIPPDKSISLFVKGILVFEETADDQRTALPFYADGYPGLMFHETKNGLLVSPHNKKMPGLFLYGQTIKPIELIMNGPYELIVFQLFPFVLKSFFHVNPKDINDDCYDLRRLKTNTVTGTIRDLQKKVALKERVRVITSFLDSMFQASKNLLDFKINQAIRMIIAKNGQIIMKQLCKELKISERTFERRFSDAVGISAKQFSKIIQFQSSLQQLTLKDYTLLTDIVYSNGFADQSHFIKVFKAFTGTTPKKFSA